MKVIQFRVKPKRDNRVADFLGELETTKELFLLGELDKIIIISSGKDLKCCSSNGLKVSDAKEMFRDFLCDPKQYID